MGYKVLFIYRNGSVFPFTKRLRKNLSPHIDGVFLSKMLTSGRSISAFSPFCDYISLADGGIKILSDDNSRVSAELRDYQYYLKSNLILAISFDTVTEYLQLLQNVSETLTLRGVNVLYYLTAAVSDFYIPADKLAVHKIQSTDIGNNISGRGLDLHLDNVPKCLRKLTQEWAPSSFVVSFKLETDFTILIQKAVAAIRKYKVHLVVANVLQVRELAHVEYVMRSLYMTMKNLDATLTNSTLSPHSLRLYC